MTYLDLNEILSIKKRKELKEKEFINEIIQNIKIRIQLKKKCGLNFLIYSVPNFIIGLPIYNSIKITKMIIHKLLEDDINANYLYENNIYIEWEKKEKENKHLDVFLKKAMSKIKKAALNNKDNCIFEIPVFLPGYPLYNYKECSDFIINEFNNNNFVAKLIYENQIYLSWNVDDIQEESGLEIKFRNEKQRKEEETKETNKFNLQKIKKLKNPNNMIQEEETITEENDEKEFDYSSYFELESNPSKTENFYPEASSFYRYFDKFPKQEKNKNVKSDNYRNNTKTLDIFYNNDKSVCDNGPSKISFSKKKKRNNRTNNEYQNRLKLYDKHDYCRETESLKSFENDLQQLKKQVNNIKNKS